MENVHVAAPARVRQARVVTAGVDRLVYSGAALYAAVCIAAVVVAYLTYDVARFDLGNMVQAVWSTAHGHFLEQTTTNGVQASRLGSHVDPFLVLLVPLWLVWPSPIMLLVAQALAVTAGALPVYWLGRKHLASSRAAAFFAFAYLLYPATQFNAAGVTDGFHAVSVAIPLILFAVWFLDEGRMLPFAVLALLAAATKEEIALSVGCLGLWYAVRRGRRSLGLAIFAIGAAITIVDFAIVIPHFSATGVSPFAGRYTAVGGTPDGIVRTLFTHPLAIVDSVATWHNVGYFALLFAPFLGLWALEPLLLLGAVPDLAINVLSSRPEQTEIYWQYTAGIIPFLVVASVLGASRLRRRDEKAAFSVLALAVCLAVVSPVYRVAVRDSSHLGRDPVHAAKAHALSLVPAGVAVSSSNQLGAMLSARRFIYTLPVVRDARWVVADRGDSTYSDRAALDRRINRLEHDRRWRLVFRSHGIDVLRRR
jgi:uncharacterized membrane protein